MGAKGVSVRRDFGRGRGAGVYGLCGFENGPGAGLVKTPECLDFTAIQELVGNHVACESKASKPGEELATPTATKHMQASIQFDVEKANDFRLKPRLGFIGEECLNASKGLAYLLTDYLELREWFDRAIVEGNLGSIPDQ